MLSIETFDPKFDKRPVFDSPRTVEACRRLGFEETELLFRDIDAIDKSEVPEEFADDLDYYREVKAEFLERKRAEKVEKVRKMREVIIEDGLEKDLRGDSAEQRESEDENRRFIEREKKRIEKMVDRKNKEVAFFQEKERRKQEILEKLQENQRKIQEKEVKLRQEMAKKQENAEFARLIREQKKTDAFERKLHESQLFLQRQAESERKKEEQQRVLEESRKAQVESKERLRKEKIERISSKIQELFAEKERTAKNREVERMKKAEKMRLVQEEARARKARENTNATLEFRRKIERIQWEKESEKARKVQLFRESEEKIAVKKQEIENKRLADSWKRREESEQKLQEIQKKLAQTKREADERKQRILEKYSKIEQKRLENLELRHEEVTNKKIKGEIRESRVRESMGEQLRSETQHKQAFARSLEGSLERVSANKQAYLKELKRRHILRHLREEDARLANQRLMRLDRESRVRILESLDEKAMKIEKSRLQKEKAMRERQKLAMSLQMEKDKALKSLSYTGKSLGNSSFRSSPKERTFIKDFSIEKPRKETPEKTEGKALLNSRSKEGLIMRSEGKPKEKGGNHRQDSEKGKPSVRKGAKKPGKAKGSAEGLIPGRYLEELFAIEQEKKLEISEILSQSKDSEDFEGLGNRILQIIASENAEDLILRRSFNHLGLF